MMKRGLIFLIVLVATFFLERQAVTSKKDRVNYTEESTLIDQSEIVDIAVELDLDTLFYIAATSFVLIFLAVIFVRQFVIFSEQYIQKTPYYLLFQTLKIG
jgi:hypothetical protein